MDRLSSTLWSAICGTFWSTPSDTSEMAAPVPDFMLRAVTGCPELAVAPCKARASALFKGFVFAAHARASRPRRLARAPMARAW